MTTASDVSEPLFPQRQVHLDFHTSALIPGIGTAFDAGEFAETAAAAHLDSMTIFAVCHHGMAYFPSKAAPQHPHLEFDLLGAQIEALHSKGIRCPIYITVAWNYDTYNKHPEWRMIDRHGNSYQGPGPGFYGHLQWLNNGYEEQLQAVVTELFDGYGKEVDGLFFDIVFTFQQDGGPYDDVSLAIREKQGWMEPTLENGARMDTYLRRTFALRMNKLIRKYSRTCTIFYNNAHNFRIEPALNVREELDYQTQMEMESLPSGQWGYAHFPRFARFTQILDTPGLGMTGKFQKTWGDFGGRKNRAALEYECFRSQAFGFGNSVGDQLHPSGALCPSTYQLIGQVYEQTKSAEPFYAYTESVAPIGILSPGAIYLDATMTSMSEDGVIGMLEELHYECQLLDAEADLSKYELVILPDSVVVDEALAHSLSQYVKSGGALILSGNSGLDRYGSLHWKELPFQYLGAEKLFPTYWRYSKNLAPADRLPMDEVMYEQGYNWKPQKGAKSLVKRVLPYFNRTNRTFSSHGHTPPDKPSRYPAIARSERIFLFADPIFRAYRRSGNRIYRELFRHAVEELLGPPKFGEGLPESVLVTVRRRAEDAHLTLLHYIPVRKALEIDIVDRPQSLGGLPVRMRLDEKPASVRLFGADEDLEIDQEEDGTWRVLVPLDTEGRVLLIVRNAFPEPLRQRTAKAKKALPKGKSQTGEEPRPV